MAVEDVLALTLWSARSMDRPRQQKTGNMIDAEVGARVRTHRRLLGMTQSDLAVALGVSFQQVQKYEKGVNRIGAGRLHEIAAVLGIPVAELFGDKPQIECRACHGRDGTADQESEPADIALTSDGLALARSFVRISNARVRQRVVRLVEELSKVADDCRAVAIPFGDDAANREGRWDSDHA
ncbi:MAG: helix-turn-helix domain-containing protein [Pseudomonadota bacterium]